MEKRAFLSIFCSFVSLVSLLCLLASCASVPVATEEKTKQDDDVSFGQGIPLIMPKRGKTYFSSINEDIVSLVETGSPSSIRQALQKIKKADDDYKETEKVLINIASSIMDLVWQSEHFSFSPPPISSQNIYMGAIEAAKRGVYDTSTGNSDFLSIVLPSLLLVTVESKTDYYDKSFVALNSGIKINSSSVLAKYLLGVLCQRQAQMKKEDKTAKIRQATSLLEEANANCPGVYEIQKALAQIYGEAGRTQDLLALSKDILLSFPNDVDILKLMAKTTYNAGDLDLAQDYIARVLQKESGDLESIRLRARILMQKGDFIRAATLLDMHARIDKTNVEYLLLRAKIQKDWNKNFTAATATLQEAVKLYPDDEQVLQEAASLASDVGVSIGGMSAVQLADLALQKDPNDIEALRIKAQSYIKQKDWANAFSLNNQILKNENSSPKDLQRQVDICLSTGRMDAAYSTAHDMYMKTPQDESAVEAYIKVLVAQRKYTQANNVINSLMPTATSAMKSFFFYEKSYFATNEDEVFSALRSSLTANPRNKDALFRMYKVYFDKKDYRKAQYYLKQVVSLDPTDATMLELNGQLEKLLQ